MAVNMLPVEDYLRGVVGAEMGRRGAAGSGGSQGPGGGIPHPGPPQPGPLEDAGLRPHGHRGRSSLCRHRVRSAGLRSGGRQETTGEVLTYRRAAIDAFFHSTCAGRTADGTEVFAGADRPYLRSIRDEDAGGSAWCAISPRYRWQEQLDGRGAGPDPSGNPSRCGRTGRPGRQPRDIRVVDRTATGRVARSRVRQGGWLQLHRRRPGGTTGAPHRRRQHPSQRQFQRSR